MGGGWGGRWVGGGGVGGWGGYKEKTKTKRN